MPDDHSHPTDELQQPIGRVPVDDIAEPAKEEHQPLSETMPMNPSSMVEVVGLGGSAGGVQALIRFFRSVDTPAGVAYVVILHLSPEHESSLAEILQRETSMPVIQAKENVKVKPDHVYVISPGNHLSMADGNLFVTDMTVERGKRVAVDLFFRTLADSHGPKATAIVLSGGDADGALG